MPALARGVIPGRAPSFPMPLDHPSSGLRGVTGSVQAGVSPAQRPAQAPRQVAPRLTAELNKSLRTQRLAGATNERFNREMRQERLAQRPPQKQGTGLLGTALGFPAKVGNVLGAAEIKGYQNLASATGIKPLGLVGKAASELVNIPAQAPVAAYMTGRAAGAAVKGHPQELEQMGKELAKESAVAHFFTGDFKGALEKAEQHPVGTALEAGGVATLGDRVAGYLKDSIKHTAVADGAVISREPKPLPTGFAPKGGVALPLKPYDRGALRRSLEKASEKRPMGETRAEQTLGKNFDHFEAGELAATRASRDKVGKEHHQLFRKLGPHAEAVPNFGSGLLPDPKHLDPNGRPALHRVLGDMLSHWEREPLHETIEGAKARREVVAQLRGLQENPNINWDRAYAASNKIAADARALEPEMAQHHMANSQTMRISKLIKPFHTHFRDQNPFVEPTNRTEGSPFYLGGPPEAGGRNVSVDEVAKKLEAKGVHEDQLIFTSTRPFMTEAQALRSGRSLGGKRMSSGHLTGHNYINGHFDPSPEAITRQLQMTHKAINEARGQNEFNRRYPFRANELTHMLRARLDHAETPGQRTTLEGYAHQLATGKDIYFRTLGEAKTAQDHLGSLGIQLEPVRVAHPYANSAYREGMAQRFTDHADMQDRLEVKTPAEEAAHSRLPAQGADPTTAGPWALVHPKVADKIKGYEDNLGKAHLGQLPSSGWRRFNVAYSVRHYPGVAQEMGVRLASLNAGLIRGLQGTRWMHYIREWADEQKDPALKHQLQLLEGRTGGTIGYYSLQQGKHIPLKQIERTPLGKPMKWWVKGEARKVTGFPLRAMKSAISVTNRATNGLLRLNSRYVEHPPVMAYFGKHVANEYKALTGKRAKALGAMNDLEKQVARGILNPRGVEHAANVLIDFGGDWQKSSPGFRNLQAWLPFVRWYANSLRFIYWIMPKDHPVQSALLTAMETATREQRQREGQEYRPVLKLAKGQLPAYQQGSFPGNVLAQLGIGKEAKGERTGQEYYTPGGAVSGGLEGWLGALAPYAVSIYSTMKGVDPLTNKPLEEKNPQTGKKEPITDEGKLFLMGALAGVEEAVPPLRYGQQLGKKPPGYVFRPLRTEKEHKIGAKKAKSNIGSSVGGGLGGSIGSSLP